MGLLLCAHVVRLHADANSLGKTLMEWCKALDRVAANRLLPNAFTPFVGRDVASPPVPPSQPARSQLPRTPLPRSVRIPRDVASAVCLRSQPIVLAGRGSFVRASLRSTSFLADCCNTADCAGYNYSATTKSGCMFKNLDGGFVVGDANTTGHTKFGFVQPHGDPADMAVTFAEVGIFEGSTVEVYDIWAQKVVATTNASNYTVAAVPWQVQWTSTSFLAPCLPARLCPPLPLPVPQ